MISFISPMQNIFTGLATKFHAKVFSHPNLKNKNYHSTPKFFSPFTQNNMWSPLQNVFHAYPNIFGQPTFFATPPTIFLPPLGAPKFSEFTGQSHFILGFMCVKQLSKTHSSQNLKRKNRLGRSNFKESSKIKVMVSFLPYILKY